MSHEFNEDEWQNIQDRLEQASKTERERIIKLLEQMDIEIHYTTWFDAQGNVMNRLASPETLDREKVFALIKGENK